MDLAALLCKQLHLLLDNAEDKDLLVLVQNAITTLIEHLNKLSWSGQPQQVIDLVLASLVDQSHVGLVEQTFVSEVSLPDGLPDLFALASTANEWPGFLHKLQSLVSWHVSQTGESLSDASGHADGVASLCSARHSCVVCLVD